MIWKNKGKILVCCCLFTAFSCAAAFAANTQPVTEIRPITSLTASVQPVISANSVRYDEQLGRYICHGNVRINLGDRLIAADEAQITSDLSAIWTQGHAKLTEGENTFSSEAIYARPLDSVAYFFGDRCKLKRPGLAIDSDSIEYNWQDKTADFDGHVLLIDSSGERVAAHLEYDFNKNKAS